MINFYNVTKFCCEDISLIENYEAANNDTTQTWHCHHILETTLGLSRAELIDRNLYFDRPASELIFMTSTEHNILHKTGKHHSEETKKKQSDANRGKHHSEETIQKISEKRKGEKNPMYGKTSPNRGKHRVYRNDGSYYMSF